MYESILRQFCSYHIYINYVTYDLRSILLRQYLRCNQKRNVQCKKDLTDYLTNLGVSGSWGFGTRINEADVILNRTGLHSLSEGQRDRITVCPKHRHELTTHYHKLKSSCSHPSHRGEVKKLKNPRRVNKRVSEEIYQEFQVSVPIGSGKYNTEANIQIIYSYFTYFW